MKNNIFLVIVFCFAFLFSSFAQNPNKNYQPDKTKMDQLINSINAMYVDSVDFDPLVDKAIVAMLKELDPHTAYIPKKDVAAMNEPLQGTFDGIGVTFQLIKDTINVMEVIVNGPSEKVGLLAGDKIIKVDDTIAYGDEISNDWVRRHLRGAKGSKVKVSIKRGHNPELLDFVITRGAIPMHSINVFFMADENTGYIKLERFAATSTAELTSAIKKLKKQGMEDLILDLRGNGGGYLNVAFEICDQFIAGKKMIVYTDNFRKTGEQFYSEKEGLFEEGRLVVLVDENSASASEITSGCVQDWDRGLVIGRRTFGKGLVQKPLTFVDQSQVRLTISHYYTPTGRCIQKPYDDGLDDYFKDIQKRANRGELYTADSIQFPDSLKYKTPHGRIVYGGGGIMPDIFVPLDTTKYSTLYNEIVRKGVFGSFVADYIDENRESLKQQYPRFEDFQQRYVITDDFYNKFMQYAKKEGVSDSASFKFSDYATAFLKGNADKLDSIYTSASDLDLHTMDTMFTNYVNKIYGEAMRLRNETHVGEFIKQYLKYEIARSLYGYGEAYRIFLESDDTYQKAIEVMHDKKLFKKFKVYSGKSGSKKNKDIDED
ncbi:MAG: PDZ domain-containing protein [Bacteroidales bacterium]|nr:PDZ domain-containing protein [Bacteroidales bacterium]